MKVILIADECPVTGELGLFVEGVPRGDDDMFAAIGDQAGALIAHDIVEHPSLRDIGSVRDELMALGAAWYTRGQWGDISRGRYGGMHSPQRNLASDYDNSKEYWINRSEEIWRIPRTRSSDVTLCFDEAMEGILEEMEKPADFRERVCTKVTSADHNFFKHAMLHLGREGVRCCRKRWGTGMEANSMFWNIADEVSHVASRVEWEGQRWEMTIVKSRKQVFIEEVTDDDYY